jgi:hypothetical protein
MKHSRPEARSPHGARTRPNFGGGRSVMGGASTTCGPGARRRYRCILVALSRIEQCLWEHLYIGRDPPATLVLLASIKLRLGRLEREISGVGSRSNGGTAQTRRSQHV